MLIAVTELAVASLSHLAIDRPTHYQFFTFWPRGLTPGPKFTKLGGSLQEAPLRHPVKFQPDRANSLRDVRYRSFSLFGLGLTPGPKFINRGYDLLPTILPNFITLRQPMPEIS